ncbi:MAG: hypothetical protein IK115_09095 [Lachnospiraceae bacterium]|nr:hypothetical protein [Lachnospiraceae bacterium]
MRLASYVRGIGIGMAVTALILHFSDGRTASAISDEEIKARAAQLGMTESTRLSEAGKEGNISANTTVSLVNVGESGLPGLPGLEEAEATPAPTEEQKAADTPTPTKAELTTPTPDTAEEKAAATATPIPTNTPTPAPTNTPTPTPEPTATPTPWPTNTPTPTPTVKPTNTPTPTVKVDAGGDQKSTNTEEKEITVVAGDGSYTVARRLAEAGIVPSAAEFDEFLCKNGYDRKICTGRHIIPAGVSYTRIAEILTGK